MDLYTFALFLHVVGALGFFVGLGLEEAGLHRLRLANDGRAVGEALAYIAPVSRLYQVAGGTLLLSGLYLTFTAWGPRAWILVSLAIVTAFAVTGPRLAGRRLAALGLTVAHTDGPLAPETRVKRDDPLLHEAHFVRIALALGVVVLMVVKPGPAGSLVVVAVAALLGWLAGWPAASAAPDCATMNPTVHHTALRSANIVRRRHGGCSSAG